MAKASPIRGIAPSAALADNARGVIVARLSDVLEWAPRGRDEADGASLHNLRIAVKRLRYALEFLGPAFGEPAAAYLEQATALQEALGMVTDCDAFMRHLASHEPQEPGLAHDGWEGLAERLRQRRREQWLACMRLLDEYDQTAVWARILRDLCQPPAERLRQ